jgi:cell wall-associated NlpC family hydrolase
MGDVTGEMIGAGSARRLPFVGVALAVAAALVGLLFVVTGGHHAKPAGHGVTTARKVEGELNLTSLTAEQMKPLSARVSASSVRLHPKLVKVAGVGADGYTSAAGDDQGTSSDANAPSNSDVERQLAEFRSYLRSTPGVPVAAAAAVLPDGTAVAPLSAPSVVAAVIQGGNEIAKTPYKWGGGHGAWADNGYDCSGSVSFALAGAGLLGAPLTSGELMHWGAPGPGRWITIYANGGHTFMVVAGLRFDTSGRSGPLGTRWQPALRSTAGFAARHPAGL